MDNAASRFRNAIFFLRIIVALLMLIHGAARISLGIVDDFGGFFESKGFPFGFYLAWAITIFEIVGGLAMAIGFAVTPIAILFIVQLVTGILMIHVNHGWFVVGAGRNGMEYSALLVAALFAVAYSHFGQSLFKKR